MTRDREQRGTFRVAVKPGTDIEATLSLAGHEWPGRVGDVSPEGIFIKLDRGLLPALRIDSRVNVEITYEGETLHLYGVVRSEHAGGYGVLFPPRDPRGRANPLEQLGRIWTQLQRTELSQRLRALKLPK
jgi:PilZ domain